MKKIRLLGVDDGPFQFGDEKTPIVGVVMRLPAYIEGMIVDDVTIDGTDATEKIISMISGRFADQIRIAVIDGVALGGFNVVDIDTIYKKTGTPVITVTREKPDMAAIKRALIQNFEDWMHRLELITKHEIYRVDTIYGEIYVSFSDGITLEEAKSVLQENTVRGNVPECVRIAHMVATAIVRGQSSGKA